MNKLRAEIAAVAPTDLSVIIHGERGTGKELVARELHCRSARAGGPFIGFNCATLQETLVESELFGCEKGAFTGAEFRKGRFEMAHRGTLFLDEVGELSLTAQPKLLRVLQEREVDRVGGKTPIPTDFRLIAATNRNLEQMTQNEKFREDLYDRINMDAIRIPPLRERPEDIPVLAEYFIGVYTAGAARNVTHVSQPVLKLFEQYAWPGNIRELENVIRRAVFKGKTEQIRIDDLPFDFAQKTSTAPVTAGKHHEKMRAYSRQLFVAALDQAGGNRVIAMKILDLPRATFYRLLKLHQLNDGAGSRINDENAGNNEIDWV